MTQSDLIAKHRADLVKQIAKECGFEFCGISKADQLQDEARHLEQWLNKNMHGQMGYMANHFDKRIDPRQLVPGAKSVISLLLNYYPEIKQRADAPKISMYAYGDDYHTVIKNKLFEMLERMRASMGEIGGRVFVDSAPVMDKAWAQKSGLGWIGKNSNLITKQQGSYFFIAELILDIELAADGPIKDYCGSCTRCIDACPTDAIVSSHVVDGSKCISYFTIELKDQLPNSIQSQLDDWMFGCDVCQQVCPWNRFSKPHQTAELKAKAEILNWDRKTWNELTEEVFSTIFDSSALKRKGFSGLKQTLELLNKKD